MGFEGDKAPPSFLELPAIAASWAPVAAPPLPPGEGRVAPRLPLLPPERLDESPAAAAGEDASPAAEAAVGAAPVEGVKEGGVGAEGAPGPKPADAPLGSSSAS